MNKTKSLTLLTMFIAMAIVLNLVEYYYIPSLPYGIRFGIANIISLIVVYKLDIKSMLIVNIFRVLLSSFIKGTFLGSSFYIALSGIILSSLCLIICKKLDCSILFTSIMSSLFHSIGQVLMVIVLYNQVIMISYLPILLIGSIGTGILTGIIAKLCIERVKI